MSNLLTAILLILCCAIALLGVWVVFIVGINCLFKPKNPTYWHPTNTEKDETTQNN